MRPSLEPCADANPVLWTLFCNITGRDPIAVNNRHWTEVDVYNWARDWIVRGRVAEMSLTPASSFIQSPESVR